MLHAQGLAEDEAVGRRGCAARPRQAAALILGTHTAPSTSGLTALSIDEEHLDDGRDGRARSGGWLLGAQAIDAGCSTRPLRRDLASPSHQLHAFHTAQLTGSCSCTAPLAAILSGVV